MEQLGSHWVDLQEILSLFTLHTPVAKIQVPLKSDKNNGTLHEDKYTFFITRRSFFLRMRKFQTKVEENINTCSMFNNVFRKSCRS